VSLVEIGRIVVLIGDPDTNEFRHYSKIQQVNQN
jgi:hypothetical protein